MKCEIIRDLLPLYCDGLCSEASKQEIEAHVAQCEGCRAFLAEMKEETPVPSLSQESETEARVLQGVKKKFSRGRRPSVLQVVPAQQHFHLCRLPDALRLAHHPAPAQGARHPLTLAGGCAPGKAVGQNSKHHAIVPQQMAGIPPKLRVQLPPHASEILEVDIIITDGQLRKIGFHSTLHRGHRSFPPQAAQVIVIR